MPVDFKLLKNQYFALRHAHSLANQKNIVLSNPTDGIRPEWGLSDSGRKQCQSKFMVIDPEIFSGPVTCISSDFSRALQTAELFCRALKLNKPRVNILLRERFFGDLEKKPADRYEEIWQQDQNDDTHQHLGCESVAGVVGRLTELIDELEQKNRAKSFVLVSHGDTLQICQAIFSGIAPGLHRSLPHLENAELRKLG